MTRVATRYEKVVLDIESSLASVMARDAAAAKLLERSLNDLDGTTTSTSRTMTPFGDPNGPIASTGRQSATASAQIDRFSGRLRLLADAAALVGPAMIPIGAVAIPAVAGLAAQLGFAALAGGTAIAAFQGVGDALTAVNKAHIDPTAENLEKARNAMENLSPAARSAVGSIREFVPLLKSVRDEAAAGLFPGFTEALDQITDRMPDVERIMARVADTIGDLMAGGAASLSSDRWDEFFDFLATDAQSALSEMARSVGNLTHGLAEMWMAFDPLNDSFSRWMVDVTNNFDDWAQGLDQTEGFQEFIDYIRVNGPKVADAMGSIANMVLQVVEAASPLGGPVLEALAGIADAVAAIADSDLGTPLFAGLAAMTLLTRATKVWGSTSVVSAREFVSGQAQALAATRTSAASMSVLARNTLTAGAASQRMATQSAAARTNLAHQATVMGKAAGTAGLFAVAMTDLDDKAGLTNTTMGAMIGMMGGPWGVAAGAAIGLTLDAAAANDNLEQSLRDVTDALASANATTDLYAIQQAMDANRQSVADFKHEVENVGWNTSFSTVLAAIKNDVEDTFGQSDVEEFEAQLVQADVAAKKLAGTWVDSPIAWALGKTSSGYEDFAQAQDQAGHAGLRLLGRMKAQQGALDHSREVAAKTANAFFGLGDGLDDAKVSLGDWLKQLEDQADALRNFRKNAEEAANKGLRYGLIDALRQAGPEGALRMRQLANATDAEIDRANRAWKRGQDEIKRYTDAVGGVPTAKTTKITAETRQAMGALGSVRDFIASINDKDVTIRVHTVRTDPSGADFMSGGTPRPIAPPSTRTVVTSDASDGLVARTYSSRAIAGGSSEPNGPSGSRSAGGRSRSDGGGKYDPYNLPTPPKVTAFDRLLAEWLRTIRRLNHMSDEELSHRTGLIRSLKDEMAERRHDLRERERMLEKELKQAESKWQAERDLLKEMRDARRSLMQDVSGNFMSSLFGNVDLTQAFRDGQLDMSQVWAFADRTGATGSTEEIIQAFLGSLDSTQLQALQGQAQFGSLQNDSQNAQQFQDLLAQLTGLGFDGGAFSELASSGNLGMAQWLASQGADYIDMFEQQYEARNQSAQAVGQQAANAVWADAIRLQAKDAARAHDQRNEMNHRLNRVEHAIDDVTRALERLPEPIGRETAAALNDTAATAARSA